MSTKPDQAHPKLLAAKLRSIQHDDDDQSFFDFAERVLDWTWHSRDTGEVTTYAKQAGLKDFTRVGLPQGLVSAGFFANVVLLAFDDGLRATIGGEIAPGVRLHDACRYVDDLRIVVTTDSAKNFEVVEHAVAHWLTGLLEVEAPGLNVSQEKTKAAEIGGAEYPPMVRQSTKMNRIQSTVSGGFDAIEGQDILDAIQGLMRSQEELSRGAVETGWRFSPLPDVRDDTVARFAAARFRTTYRSIRPLFEDDNATDVLEEGESEVPLVRRSRTYRNQRELDEDAHAFALGLIERWVADPSNVRLLRIGLDLWPDANVLKAVVDLLRPFTEKGGRRKAVLPPSTVATQPLSRSKQTA